MNRASAIDGTTLGIRWALGFQYAGLALVLLTSYLLSALDLVTASYVFGTVLGPPVVYGGAVIGGFIAARRDTDAWLTASIWIALALWTLPLIVFTLDPQHSLLHYARVLGLNLIVLLCAAVGGASWARWRSRLTRALRS